MLFVTAFDYGAMILWSNIVQSHQLGNILSMILVSIKYYSYRIYPTVPPLYFRFVPEKMMLYLTSLAASMGPHLCDQSISLTSSFCLLQRLQHSTQVTSPLRHLILI